MKIGIYGGTFDPPHNGHVHACKSFLETYKVDKMYIIPTFIPPHKVRDSNISAEMRMEMSKLAFEGIADNVEISDIELKRQGTSYTADTLKQFKDIGCEKIYLLCGTDMFVTLDTWRNPKYIFESATIVCIRRENHESMVALIDEKSKMYKEVFGADIEFIHKEAIEVSSSDLRKNIVNLKDLVPSNVFRYIEANNLYENEN